MIRFLRPSSRPSSLTLALMLAGSLLLSACGGGGSASAGNSSVPTCSASGSVLMQEPGAPVLTGNTATDGFNWFNFRRQQAGLPLLSRNVLIDRAAQSHSDYLRLNGVIVHNETPGANGYTGSTLPDRLQAAGYSFSNNNAYAYGEVISATADASGFYMAEELIAAIYHRFVIFEPVFKEAGSGAANGNGTWYFSTDFAANNGYGPGLGAGRLASWPFANQERVPTVFYSDYEKPDPVPGQNETGYPVSVHADINGNLVVQSFTISARGGNPLPVRILSAANDSETPHSAAAAIPLTVLAANTIYDVNFSGTLNGVAISKSWSFRTR